MATVVNSTIGGTTPDYTTIELWLADTEVDLTSSDEIQRGLMRDATFTEILDINGATADATRYRELTFDTDARYDPDADTGAKVTGSTTGQTVDAWENYFRFTGICIERTATAGNAVWINTNGTGVIFDGVTCRVTATSNQGFFGAVAGPILRNCISIQTLFDGTGEGLTLNAGMKAHNCTSWGYTWSISWTDHADTEIINCIAERGSGGDSSFNQYAASSLGTYTKNICIGDAWAPGVSSIQNATASSIWVDASGHDFTLAVSSDAIDYATYLGAQFTTSFDGTDRGTTGSEWDVGSYEYSASSGSTLSGILNLSGQGSTSFTADVSGSVEGTLNLSGQGSTTLSGNTILDSMFYVSGQSSLSATGAISAVGAMNLSGQGSTSFTGSVTVSSAEITLVVNKDTSSTIVAGQSIFFDTVGTTSLNTIKPYHHLYYIHDFGDSSNLDNSAIGPVVAHTYRDSGTFTYSMSAYDVSGNTATSSIDITVQDPDTVYSTTGTVSISPDADFTGAATGSTQVTTEDLATALAYSARGFRVEFKKGGTWGTNTGVGVDHNGQSGNPALITTFGSDTSANPIFEMSGTIADNLNVITHRGEEFSLRDIDFRNNTGYSAGQVAPIAGDHKAEFITTVDCSATGFTMGPLWSPFSPNAFSESANLSITVNRWECLDISGGQIYMGIGADRYALIGCNLTDADQHLVRFYKGDYFYLANTTFGSVTSDQHQLKAHADASLTVTPATSQYWNMHGNVYEASPEAWKCAIGTQNDSSDELVSDVVIDSDTIDITTPDYCVGHVIFGSYDITIRNSKYNLGGNNAGDGAQHVGQRGVEPAPSGFESYHCSMWGSGTGGDCQMLNVGTVSSTPIAKNHIVDVVGFSTAVVSNGTITGGGSLEGDASFNDPANGDYSLSTGSAAIDIGVSAPVVNAYNLNALFRVLDTSADAGAYETAASAGVTTHEGILNLSGQGSASFSGAISAVGILNLSGQGALFASGGLGGLTKEGILNLSGQGSTVLSSNVVYDSTLNLSGQGSAIFNGDVSGSVEGTLNLSGQGSLAASGAISAVGALNLSGQGSTVLTGGLVLDASSNLSGQGTFFASGGVTSFQEGTLDLSGQSSQSASATLTLGATAELSGEGTLFASGTIVGTKEGILNLSGQGSTTFSSNVDYDASSALSGFGSMFAEISKVGEYIPVDPPFSEMTESIVSSFQGVDTAYHSGLIRGWLNQLIDDAPKSKSETIREILKALQMKFKSELCIIRFDGTEQAVQCLPGNQERVIAAIRNTDKNLQLPITSIKFSNLDQHQDRRKYKNLLVTETLWDSIDRRAIRILSLAPKQVNVEIELNIWSKYQDDILQLTEQIEYFFIPSMEINTKFAIGIKVFIKSNNDGSTEVIDDGEQRVLRRTIVLSCETYLESNKFRITNTGEIEKFNADIRIVEE